MIGFSALSSRAMFVISSSGSFSGRGGGADLWGILTRLPAVAFLAAVLACVLAAHFRRCGLVLALIGSMAWLTAFRTRTDLRLLL